MNHKNTKSKYIRAVVRQLFSYQYGGGVHDVTGDYTGGNVGFAGGDIIQPQDIGSFRTSTNNVFNLIKRVGHNINVPEQSINIAASIVKNSASEGLKACAGGKPINYKRFVTNTLLDFGAMFLIDQAVDIGGNFDKKISDFDMKHGLDIANTGQTTESLRHTFEDNFLAGNAHMKEIFDKTAQNLTNAVILDVEGKCSLESQQKILKAGIKGIFEITRVLADQGNRRAAKTLYKRHILNKS